MCPPSQGLPQWQLIWHPYRTQMRVQPRICSLMGTAHRVPFYSLSLLAYGNQTGRYNDYGATIVNAGRRIGAFSGAKAAVETKPDAPVTWPHAAHT